MSGMLEEIALKIAALSGVQPEAGESGESATLRGLDMIEKQLQQKEKERIENTRRISELLDVVMALAALDYSKKAIVSDEHDHVDAIAAGINMLGEELKASTISLKEKEVLLREIHHRVKNNLQVISSLLNLQAGQITDETAREKYAVSRERIRAMALVHEKLYESKNLSGINFSDYVRSLAHSLNVSCNPDPDRIRLEVDASDSSPGFRIDTAIPCALVLNELLLNAFKHAFPENKKGRIDVFFGSDPENAEYFLLQVSDDGIGIPEGLDPELSETLGLQLVHILSEQLQAKLSVNNENGAHFTLRFRGE
ncbi:MAG: signal transduction histidine kinase [Bacteroidetes bacterium]|nr:MAG: signal transduction histidine kinase [Bacteroidota bacterium]